MRVAAVDSETKDHSGMRKGAIDWVNQKGFTLLETLVAFMVLSIVLVVILQVFSGGIRSRHKSDRYLNATFHARAKMEELMATRTRPGSYSGAFDNGYQWQAEIGLIDNPDDSASDMETVRMSISVKVSWRANGRRIGIELHSLKLVPEQS